MELAHKLRSYAGTLPGGGVTFSGGEPLMQANFVAAVCDELPDMHKALQTSGYADSAMFQALARRMDYILFDLKLADPVAHKQYTGRSNDSILQNFVWLKTSGISYVVRIPLIPGITDTQENLTALAGLTRDCQVELAPYNPLAGAKYPMVNRLLLYEVATKNEVDISLFERSTSVDILS
ncbi:MAG: radical SAM protein [Oscillospiraceae bacterium]|nr:radical SAM protein [Oscillospiraceae bacterium]MDD4413454.1 radical SAM protein [Oscillospiraceae bacterium]